MKSLFFVEGTVAYYVPPAGTAPIPAVKRYSTAKKKIQFDSWIKFGPIEPHGGSSLTQSVRELLQLTDWSHRKLASVLKTTHPTIASILRGKVPDRVQGLVESASQLLNVVRRIWLASGRDRARFLAVLGGSDNQVVALLANAQYPDAYIIAAKLLSPRKDRPVLMTTSIQRDPSKDVALLVDDGYGE